MINLYLEKYKISADEYQLMVRYQKLVNKCKRDSEIKKEEKLKKSEIDKAKEIMKKVSCVVLFSDRFFSGFKKRYNLVYRKINHVSVKSAMELKPCIAAFISDIHNIRSENDYPMELIINFDETPIFFDSIPSYSGLTKIPGKNFSFSRVITRKI